MTEYKGFRRGGFRPRFAHCHRRAVRRRFAGAELFCSPSVTPGRSLCRPRVLAHDEVLSHLSRRDGWSHIASIQRDLSGRFRHGTWRVQCGVIWSAVRGLPTNARVSGLGWISHTATIDTITDEEHIASEPSPGQSARARSASDALSPTRERGAFRAIQL